MDIKAKIIYSTSFFVVGSARGALNEEIVEQKKILLVQPIIQEADMHRQHFLEIATDERKDIRCLAEDPSPVDKQSKKQRLSKSGSCGDRCCTRS